MINTESRAITQFKALPNMPWIPGGNVPHGFGGLLPRRTTSARSDRRWFLDGSLPPNKRPSRNSSEATDYITLAERELNPADFLGAPPEIWFQVQCVFKMTRGCVDLNDYTEVVGLGARNKLAASVRAKSSIEGMEQHPVVQVAYEDAEAYARWAGRRTSHRSRMERAARGGLEDKKFTWGDEPFPDGRVMANSWQGEFPWENLLIDGFEGTSPAGIFPPNGYGLFDMAGNVWEWTSDWYVHRHADEFVKSCCGPAINPRIASPEKSYDPRQPQFHIPRKVVKGGSYLCAT